MHQSLRLAFPHRVQLRRRLQTRKPMKKSPRKKISTAVYATLLACLTACIPLVMAASVIDQAEQSVVRVINIDQQGNRLTISGVGSGVVIDRAGFILTNEHVIARADKVYVQWKTSGGEVRDDEAELVAQDPQKDLALLRVRRIDAPIVSIATGVLAKGQTVFAIGFPGAADLP
ncbi:MAG: trypsin-like peptidase domain-containing protein, partial [Gammaproteobacteria bacterium]|nr:trypsin-like peptidase domain-containing protein [Gammaproteobacteria bacterium]